MNALEKAIAALPGPGIGPFERIVATCRPGEIDVTVRCLESGASLDFVLASDGALLDLPAHRTASDAGLTVSPADTTVTVSELSG